MPDTGIGIDWSDPLLLGLIGGVVLVVVLLLAVLGAARRAGRAAEPLAAQVVALAQGQQQLVGGLTQVTNAQLEAQSKLLQTLEHRLEQVSSRMGESLTTSATRTAKSLGALQQRLEAIDKAQTKIEKLSGEVLTLQDILSNKQTRGAFGEFQLQEIVSHALPPDAYTFQHTLSNGRRADCLIHLPLPPGPIVIDSKFPLEAYEALLHGLQQLGLGLDLGVGDLGQPADQLLLALRQRHHLGCQRLRRPPGAARGAEHREQQDDHQHHTADQPQQQRIGPVEANSGIRHQRRPNSFSICASVRLT